MQRHYTYLPSKPYPEDMECVYIHSDNRGAIYVSNVEAAENIETLRKFSIKGVLTACKGVYLGHSKREVPYYLYVPGEDHQRFNISKYFHESAEFIKEVVNKGYNVLVHCMAGISRSVALVLAYLIKYEELGLRDAFLTVKQKRKIINPNRGFLRQLKTFKERLPSSSEKCFVQSGKTKIRSLLTQQPESSIDRQKPLQKDWREIKYIPSSNIDYHKIQQKFSVQPRRSNQSSNTIQNPESEIKKKNSPLLFEDLSKELDKKIAQIRKKYMKATHYLYIDANSTFSKPKQTATKTPLTPTGKEMKRPPLNNNPSSTNKSRSYHSRGFSHLQPPSKYLV